MNPRGEQLQAFNRLLDIMDDLREKCPWDKKQTFESLSYLTIEETYELVDAIRSKDLDGIREELGDLFLHLVFYSKIASENRNFDIADALNQVCEKLIHRHPHVYENTIVKDEKEVLQNWEKLKLKEGKKSILSGVPKSLPALLKAYRIQEKVKGIGFEFENENQTWGKVLEEIQEFKIAKNSDEQTKEFGDLMFSLINYARFIGINPENALEQTNSKFHRRFQKMEELAKERNLEFAVLSLNEKNLLWEESKSLLQ